MAISQPINSVMKFMDEFAMANAVADAIQFKFGVGLELNSPRSKIGKGDGYFRFQYQINSRYTLSVILEESNPINGNLDAGVFDKENDDQLTTEFFSHGDTVDVNNYLVDVADLFNKVINATKIKKQKKGNVIAVQFNSPKQKLFDYIDSLSLVEEKEQEIEELEIKLVNSKTLIMTHSKRETQRLESYFMRKHGISDPDDLKRLYEFVNPMPENLFDRMFEDESFRTVMRVKPSAGIMTPDIEKRRYSDFTKYVAKNYLADDGTLAEIDMRNL